MATLNYKDFLAKAINDHGFLRNAIENPKKFREQFNLSPNLASKLPELQEILSNLEESDPQELNQILSKKLNNIDTAWRDGFTDNYTDHYSDDG